MIETTTKTMGIFEAALLNTEIADRYGMTNRLQFDRLKDSIEDIGLQKPILVTKDKRLVDGRHRVKACLDLGHTDIAYVEIENDDVTIDATLRIENSKKRNTTKQLAMTAGLACIRTGMTLRKAEEEFGVGKNSINYAKKIALLSTIVADKILAGLPVYDASDVTRKPVMINSLLNILNYLQAEIELTKTSRPSGRGRGR